MSLLLASLIVSFIAGRPIPMTCAPVTQDWGGYYDTVRDTITLESSTCSRFAAPTRSMVFAKALYTLTHEAEHAAGLRDEHETDCAALAEFPKVVARFHFPTVLDRYAPYIHEWLPAPYSGACV